jgi:ribosomal protein L44E
MTLSTRIIEACTVPAGLCLSELAAAVGDHADIVNTMAGLLVRQGRLHKAGVRRFFRYFATLAHAEAWDLVAEDDYKARMRASAVAKRQRKAERARTGGPVGRPPVPKAPPKPKKREELVLRRSEQAATPAQPTKIIWPETVKVQVHPTPPSRFAFEPPPGWRGQITHDWMDRRLQGAGGVRV